MKNYSLRKILLFAGQSFVIGLLSLTVACKDDPARLSGDVLPEGEMIKGLNYDGHELLTKNVMRESVRTSDASYGIIGKFNDPEFGSSEAGFLTDFSLGSQVKFKPDSILGISLTTGNDTVYKKAEEITFYQFNNNGDARFPYDEWIVDSLVLNLQYQFNNWYGDMLHEQKVNIYELTTTLGSVSKEYYSDHDVDGWYNTMPVGSETVFPNNEVPDSLKSEAWEDLWANSSSLWNDPSYLWDVAKVDTVMGTDFKGHTAKTKIWSFNLNEDLTERFFNLTESSLKSTGAFKNEFNGIYVALDPAQSDGDGWLTKVNLLSSSSLASNLTLHISRKHKYWKKQEDDSYQIIDTIIAQKPYSFPINVENVRFNKYTHELNATNVDIEDETPEKLYIQGMAGSYMKMQLPDDILNWTDSIKGTDQDELASVLDYRLVANVEFFMEVAMDSADIARYPVPDQLVIKWANEKGELVDPYYTIEKNGNSFSSPVFGSDADSDGMRKGIGELVPQLNDEGRVEYLYRFIMRSDYFNYIMRNQDGAGLNEKQFFIGPINTTSNFQRVVLFGGANTERPMKLNIKYYHYRPR
jgi:hypothetical protein